MRRLTALLAAAALVMSACGGGGENDGVDPGTGDTVIVLQIEDGKPVGGVGRVDVELGVPVEVVVEGELTEQVHVHGYDLYIEPDGDQSLEFVALIPGRFEIELEQSGQLLLEMTVS